MAVNKELEKILSKADPKTCAKFVKKFVDGRLKDQ